MFIVTIKHLHVISFDPSTVVVLNRIADALEGKTQAEIDKAANAIGDVTSALKTSEQRLSAAIATK